MEPVSFLGEIQSIMHACGDSRHPYRETASLIEAIIRPGIVCVCRHAVSLSRTEDRLLESLLFMMRGDASRLGHVIRNVSYKKLAKQMQRSTTEEATEDPLFGCSGHPRGPPSLSFLDPIGPDSRLDFLSLLDEQTCDSVSRERYERYELLTRSMDRQQYLEFTECRAVNFTQRPHKLRDWLSLSEERASPRILEVLGFLCYEAVRRLVETGLRCRESEQSQSVSAPLQPSDLVKQEPTGSSVTSRVLKRAGGPEPDPLPPLVSTSPLTPLRTGRHKKPRIQVPGPLHPLRPPLLPSHIREAHRRTCREKAPFFLFASGARANSRLRRAQRLFF